MFSHSITLAIALVALVASMGANLLSLQRVGSLKSQLELQRAMPYGWDRPSSHIDDSQYSYIGDDHPVQIPLHVPSVQLEIEDTVRYGISDPDAWPDWRTTDLFPNAMGFVQLGPDGRTFGVSMFHQLHCLQMIRAAVIERHPEAVHSNKHAQHCFDFIRQAILCAADTTLDPIDRVGTTGKKGQGADGVGTTHVCRDWEAVYDFVYENQMSPSWRNASSHAHD